MTEEVLFHLENNTKNRKELFLRNTFFSNLVTYPAFLLARNTDSLVLSLWNRLSLLQVGSLALLLHVSIDRLTIILHSGRLKYIRVLILKKV